MDKAARRVRLLAIGKIADRSLNSTPGSIAAHQTLFARPLREMSTAANINGVSFPGEVKPPQDGDVSIVWKSKRRWIFTLWYARMKYRCKLLSACYWMPVWRPQHDQTYFRYVI